jgi:hypothetical protein
MPGKMGELTGLDPETGDWLMRNEQGAIVRGFLSVRAGGMVVFVPGLGKWEPEPDDASNIAQERVHGARGRDAGRPPGTTKPVGENENPADARAADAERRRQDRIAAGEREQAEREARRLADEQRAADQEQASRDAIAAAAGEPVADPAGDADGGGDGGPAASVSSDVPQTETRAQSAARRRAERAAAEAASS